MAISIWGITNDYSKRRYHYYYLGPVLLLLGHIHHLVIIYEIFVKNKSSIPEVETFD